LNLGETFFYLSRQDPTHGFTFNANKLAGHAYPVSSDEIELSQLDHNQDELTIRLRLASHLAQHIRLELEERWGYTCTVGISTCKLLSKLVGNVNKPRAQTTLLPPYVAHGDERSSNVTLFMDELEVGRIPGIGFKTASKLREYVLQRPPEFDGWQLHENDAIRVRDVKAIHGVNAAALDRVLAGPGAPHGIGSYVWNLLHGIDTSAVLLGRDIPKQISIEDSYGKVDTLEAATAEMTKLSKSLIKRMRIDLIEPQPSHGITDSTDATPRWLAHPKTLRLSTRPRSLPSDHSNTGDARASYSTRISRTGPVPGFLFNVSEPVDVISARLVRECLVPLFRKLHPERSGWNLSLINVAVTNIQESGGEAKGAVGRDIEGMFRNQESTLKEWTAYNDGGTEDGHDTLPGEVEMHGVSAVTEELGAGHDRGWEGDVPLSTQRSQVSDGWVEEEATSFEEYSTCPHCGASMPSFAMAAHERFHQNEG
jgi:DNA polymerase iota